MLRRMLQYEGSLDTPFSFFLFYETLQEKKRKDEEEARRKAQSVRKVNSVGFGGVTIDLAASRERAEERAIHRAKYN